ncbi:MAG: PIN domain-containing protein [Actinobacteria bacterium]|nr:PIN domain-containing protein [Actinomycetota bacterium]MBU1942449.1 PIN domain-containing protein [Actinomycetota bacterium]MBU2686321.1 PIN domain-containing protein [Actinomycetota bacterium]
MRESQRVFLDTCCLIRAAISESGGSRYIFELARAGKLELVLTRRVVESATQHLHSRYGREAAKSFIKLMSETPHVQCENPTRYEEERWQGIIHPADLHVLAGAAKAGADVLVSTDEKHLLTPEVALHFPVPAMGPKAFCDWFMERYQPDAGQLGLPAE